MLSMPSDASNGTVMAVTTRSQRCGMYAAAQLNVIAAVAAVSTIATSATVVAQVAGGSRLTALAASLGPTAR